MKATIELPDLPDGWEVVGIAIPQKGDKFLTAYFGSWAECLQDWLSFGIVARRKQTLADWANEQPDLKVLARLLSDDFDASYEKGVWGGWVGRESTWPKPPCDGTMTTKNGKWVNA
jgi:hypothetical protein